MRGRLTFLGGISLYWLLEISPTGGLNIFDIDALKIKLTMQAYWEKICLDQYFLDNFSFYKFWVQLQFSGHQYVAVQLMRTAGSPTENCGAWKTRKRRCSKPNHTEQPASAVILILTLITLIKTINRFIKNIFITQINSVHKSTVFSCFLLLRMFLACYVNFPPKIKIREPAVRISLSATYTGVRWTAVYPIKIVSPGDLAKQRRLFHSK